MRCALSLYATDEGLVIMVMTSPFNSNCYCVVEERWSEVTLDHRFLEGTGARTGRHPIIEHRS